LLEKTSACLLDAVAQPSLTHTNWTSYTKNE